MQYKRPNRTEINNLELEILHAHGGRPPPQQSPYFPFISCNYGSTVGFYILKTSQCSVAEDEVLVSTVFKSYNSTVSELLPSKCNKWVKSLSFQLLCAYKRFAWL